MQTSINLSLKKRPRFYTQRIVHKFPGGWRLWSCSNLLITVLVFYLRCCKLLWPFADKNRHDCGTYLLLRMFVLLDQFPFHWDQGFFSREEPGIPLFRSRLVTCITAPEDL